MIAIMLVCPLFMFGPAILEIWVIHQWGLDPSSLICALLFILTGYYFRSQFLPLFHWIEVDENMLRGKRFWTRRLVEVEIIPGGPLKVLVGNTLLHHPRLAILSGALIHSPRLDVDLGSGPKFIFFRHDMEGTDEVLLAILDRVEQVKENAG